MSEGYFKAIHFATCTSNEDVDFNQMLVPKTIPAAVMYVMLTSSSTPLY